MLASKRFGHPYRVLCRMAKALIELATLVLLIAWVGYACAMCVVARLRRREFRRKVRTQTGILQLCALCPSILNPLRNRIWVQFVCHKLLRIATPYAVLLGALGVTLASPVQAVVLTMAIGGAMVAIARAVAPRGSLVARVLRQAGWGALILSAPLVATVNALKGNWNVWGVSRSSTE